MWFLFSRNRIRESVDNEHFILPFFDLLTCKLLVKDQLERSKTSIVPARFCKKERNCLGEGDANHWSNGTTKNFGHISIDPTRNIDSLISITSNGLFVYLVGLHAAGFIGIKFRSWLKPYSLSKTFTIDFVTFLKMIEDAVLFFLAERWITFGT